MQLVPLNTFLEHSNLEKSTTYMRFCRWYNTIIKIGCVCYHNRQGAAIVNDKIRVVTKRRKKWTHLGGSALLEWWNALLLVLLNPPPPRAAPTIVVVVLSGILWDTSLTWLDNCGYCVFAADVVNSYWSMSCLVLSLCVCLFVCRWTFTCGSIDCHK